ncbi:MAG: hypothetical protein QNL88_14115 [Acidobacteriota bacterium]|nr:hypothetical protein [Acidobacteriota bacterium]
MELRPVFWLPLLLALHIALALGYRAVLPLFNWPDEPAHLNRVRAVASGDVLPTMEPGAWAPAELEALKQRHFADVTSDDPMLLRFAYEHHQPPVYYVLAAVVWRLAPRPELVKLVNLALSCLVVCVPLALARARGWKDRWPALLATVLLALSPMRCFMAVSIGNGVLTELLFGVFTVAIAARCPPALVGTIIGIGTLTQIPMLLALPLYLVWLRLDGEGPSWRGIVRSGAVASAVVLAVVLPWIGHNVLAYGAGDPLALEVGAFGSDAETAVAMGAQRPRLTLLGEHGIGAFSWRLFTSWWGAFGWMEMFPDPWAALVYLGLTAVVLVGLIIGWREPERTRISTDRDEVRRLIAWNWCAVALATTAVAVYSLADFQPQGRYLLLVSIASSILFGVGARAAMGRRTALFASAAVLILVATNIFNLRWVIPWYLQ